MDELKMNDVVALTKDVPEHHLQHGEVGTIVERWNDGAYEVEFSDDSGEPYAFVALQPDQLMKLYFNKVDAVSPAPLDNEARAFLDEGFKFFNDENILQAEWKFRSAIALDPRSRGAILNSILKSFDSNYDWGGRIQALRFLYHLAPDYTHGRNNLAITYLNYGVELAREGNTEHAMTLLFYAIKLDVSPDIASKVRENYAGLLTTLAIKNHLNGDYENTVAALRVACIVFPDEKTRHNLGLAHAHLAVSYMDKGEFEAAIPVFEEALETGLILPELLNDYAIALLSEKRVDEARIALERALSSNPENHLIKDNLARLSSSEYKDSLVKDTIKADYIQIPTTEYQYQLAA